MNETIDKYIPRIREIRPGLDIAGITHNGEGLINEVFIVNNDIVFRFAKNEVGVKVLAAEIEILNLIRPHIALNIPQPFYAGDDVIAYRLLAGETFSKGRLSHLNEADKQAIAGQLADFLRTLHTIPADETLPITSAPAHYEDWVKIRRDVEEKVYPLLMTHQVEWANDLFDQILSDSGNFNYTPCLIHGDLGPYHLLFNRDTHRLNAIIDFGVSGLGDPATDLGNLLQVYGESFVSRFYQNYPQARRLMKRARFYAQAIELQWALSGIASGETFWFAAHLGGARDINRDSEFTNDANF